MNPEIRFPELTKFDQLFTGFVNKGKSDAYGRGRTVYQKRFGISISGDGYDGYDYGSVEISDEVSDYIRNNMININEVGCHFKLVCRADGSVLVVASYDQILGGHWLAFIDKNSLPEIDDE